MLRPVVEQHGNAMPMPKTVRSINVAKPLDLARGRRKIDLVSVPMIVPVGTGGGRQEQTRAPHLPPTREKPSPLTFLFVGYITSAPPPLNLCTPLPPLTNT